ncbi:MAG TPA: filamentous hemagglutinin N-terminal domain-containing protein, partial [Stellaceae bacterium]|nr:filamentous hemagglutinin N-terminal domain-containing protein [Stellaceae bacterium]
MTGESATFSGPAGIANIIGRVTGGNPSSIDGTIVSAIQGANLFLVNPFGIVFGAHASINVSGSFHASTADYVKLSDGAIFSASHPAGSTFSAAAPAAFGFLNAAPPAITVAGSTIDVGVQGTLGLVGGPVTIAGGTLAAHGGVIHIASAAGRGEIPVDPLHGPAATVAAYGPVAISGGAFLNVAINQARSGSIFMRAGSLKIDASNIDADNAGAGNGGEILLQVDGAITLSHNASVHANSLSNDGNGGKVTVKAGRLTMLAGGRISSNAFDAGNGGNVVVDVTGRLRIDGGSGTPEFATEISSATFGAGNGGSVKVRVGGLLSVFGTGSVTGITSNDFPTTSGGVSTGDAGRVSVSADELSMAGNGRIASQSFSHGNAGDVSVRVNQLLEIDGPSVNPQTPPGIFSSAAGHSTGKAGRVSVSAGSLTILANGLVSSATFTKRKAGSVSVAVAGELTIDGASGNPNSRTGIISEAAHSGKAGNVIVSAGSLSILDDGSISSGTRRKGNAGNVTVNVAGLLSIDGTGEKFFTGITSEAFPARGRKKAAAGNAGAVSVMADELSIADGGEISSSTSGAGNGGDVAVAVGGLLSIDGVSQGRRVTGINAQTGRRSTGTGGEVQITAGDIVLSGSGPQITVRSRGSGNAGSIAISAGTTEIFDGASISTMGATAKGGNIILSIGDLLYLSGGEITTSSGGPGVASNGGNITIDPPLVVLADGSKIEANANGGNGGNIGIIANAYFASPDSIVTASSQKGISGTIAISGQLVGLNGALVVLPSALRGAEAIL